MAPDEDDEHPRIPAPPIPEYETGGRKAVAVRFARLYGEEMAREIALRVLEPDAVATAIGRWNEATSSYTGGDYTSFDVPSGRLTLVEVKMPVTALVPDPTNGRVGGSTQYPVAKADSVVMPRIRRWDVEDEHELMGVLTPRATMLETARAVAQSARQALQLNKDVKGQIGQQSVLDALIGLPTVIDATDRATMRIVIIEGNTRLGGCLEWQGLEAYTGLLGLQSDPASSRRADDMRMLPDNERHSRFVEYHRDVEAVGARRLRDLDADQLARLRTYHVKVLLPVGWSAHAHAPEATVLDGLHEYVERRHVRPPTNWQKDASLAWDAAGLLDVLEREGYITENQLFSWSGDRVEDEGLEDDLDDMAMEVFALMAGAANDDDLKTILRPVLGQRYVTVASRAPLVASIVLRQRAFTSAAVYRATASAYERALSGTRRFWDRFADDHPRDPRILAKLAGRHLPESDPAGDVLALRALPYLVLHGALKRDTTKDSRGPSVIVEELLSSPRGLLFLAEAVERGRVGEPPVEVDELGFPFESATGEERVADDHWVRWSLVPPDHHEDGDDEADEEDAEPKPPEEMVADEVRAILQRLGELTESIRALGALRIDGERDQGDAEDRGEQLRWVRTYGVADPERLIPARIAEAQELFADLRLWVEIGGLRRGPAATTEDER